MSGHGTNPIFFDKKIKIGRLEHSLPLPMSDNISFLPYIPTLLKVDVILCVSPLFLVVSFSVLIWYYLKSLHLILFPVSIVLMIIITIIVSIIIFINFLIFFLFSPFFFSFPTWNGSG